MYYVQGRGITRMTVDLEGEGEYAEAVRQGKAVVGEWNPKVSPPDEIPRRLQSPYVAC